ncbi:MAG: GAF domain-containing protein [Nostocaceae cyanobacterium]|nr:GAF domain-containing protein [Nostocaceae cyanobacterium]
MTIKRQLENYCLENNNTYMIQKYQQTKAISYSVELAELMICIDTLKTEFAEVCNLEISQVEINLKQLQIVAEKIQNLQTEVQEQFVNWRQQLGESTSRMIQSTDLDSLLQITTMEVGEKIKCDRVLVYRFNSSDSGVVVAESQTIGWTPILGEMLPAIGFGLASINEYLEQQIVVIDEYYQSEITHYQANLLERLQVKSSLTGVILLEGKVWGLLVIHLCDEPRQWQEAEISFLYQITMQLSQCLQSLEYQKQLQQQQVQQACLNKIIHQIRASVPLEDICQTTIREVHGLVQCDRAAIYRFNPLGSGEIVAESVGSRWGRLLGEANSKIVWEETLWQATKSSSYAIGETLVVNDISQMNHPGYDVDRWDKLAVKAYVMMPIFSGNKLWGLMAVYQNSQKRNWQAWEINAMTQMAVVLGVAVQQENYCQQLQMQLQQLVESAEQEKADKELLQQTAMELLASVKPSLEGDLTVTAAIGEDELGTIADAYNNTLKSLRHMVLQVQNLAQQVAVTSQTTDISLADLTNLAQQQFSDIATAVVQVQLMTSAAQAVVRNAEFTEAAVRQVNCTLQGGDAVMSQTVQKIEAIRETLSHNSQQIQTLSQSCQKISRVVSLMQNCATHTNFLGLSAAMEAGRAGKYGKGFAVIAEEVRSLARQFTTAAKEIKQLVEEIQLEIQAVSYSMEASIQQVMECTILVNQTREDFHAIITATAQIRQWVEGIAHATSAQTHQALSVTNTLQEVSQVAYQASAIATHMSSSYLNLLTQSQDLLNCAGKFKVN